MYPQVFGKYVLERELARGGMARVVLATLRGAGGFEKKLVVKQIRDDLASDEEFVRRFVEEAKTTVALAHPNIVPVYELGVELGTYFLAMEYVAGASLAELLRAHEERAALSPEEGAYVGVEVCRALDYAHRRMHLVHRDVTPRNVMVDEEGQVRVIDFGISAPVSTAPGGQGVFGSPGHMPPEQMAGKELTPSADVFAVAVLLMELWSGTPPFRRRTHEGIAEAMRGPHPKPSDADIRLLPIDDILKSAMSLEPGARPQQADELARALRRFLTGVDLGDVARQLGDRVRSVRERPSPPDHDRGPVLQRPASRPTGMQVGTKTFAVRDEMKVWDPGAGPSTRRIASSAPAPSQSPRLRTSAGRRLALPSVIGAGMAAVVAFLVGRGAATSSARAPTAAPAPVSLPTPVPASAVVSTALPVSASASAPLDVLERAQLVLFGLGTVVSIDGVPRGPAPARVSVDPGPHTIVFTFPATGESKALSVTLRGGERQTVRADFTGARPTVRVERP